MFNDVYTTPSNLGISNKTHVLLQTKIRTCLTHDDVIKWKHFPRYWPFVRRIHRSPVNSQHKGQWRGALMSSLVCTWIKSWVNNPNAGDLRRHRAHCDVSVMHCSDIPHQWSSHIAWDLCSNNFAADTTLWYLKSTPIYVNDHTVELMKIMTKHINGLLYI